MSSIETRFNQLQHNIAELCDKYGRAADEVSLLAVSKTKPLADVQALYSAGHCAFGENYLQEAVEKQQQLSAAQWHFIGPLQSNKTRLAAQHMDWVQTIDREKIARRLSDQRPGDLPPLNVLVQVNISDEGSKSGVAPSELEPLLATVSEFAGLKLRGLMAIPAAADSLEQQRKPLRAMRELFAQYAERYQFDTLSMGMTADMEAAIAEGTTMLRVGTALFGSRS